MKSTPPKDIPQTDNNDRFELRDAPGPGGATISKHATRAAADEALIPLQKQNPGIEYTVADMGARGDSGADPQHIENGKTLAQKQQEEALKNAKGPDSPDPVKLSVETPRRQDAHQ